MIGLVLAAGAGRRLRPYTDHLPKALVPVDGETTILDIALHNLAAVDLREVVVVVGYAADAVEVRRADLERRHGVTLHLVHNDKAEIWNNAYSLWLACEQMAAEGALLVNGDTVHPVAVEEALLTAEGAGGEDVMIAVDVHKRLAEEEMKVQVSEQGFLSRIHKSLDPETAFGEYIGATLVRPGAVTALADALQTTFERDPDLYYEDGYQEMVHRGARIQPVEIPQGTSWVEVDDHRDLERAREIACHY